MNLNFIQSTKHQLLLNDVHSAAKELHKHNLLFKYQQAVYDTSKILLLFKFRYI